MRLGGLERGGRALGARLRLDQKEYRKSGLLMTLPSFLPCLGARTQPGTAVIPLCASGSPEPGCGQRSLLPASLCCLSGSGLREGPWSPEVW